MSAPTKATCHPTVADMRRALDEYNRSLPAWKPWYRWDQLPLETQDQLTIRATELSQCGD